MLKRCRNTERSTEDMTEAETYEKHRIRELETQRYSQRNKHRQTKDKRGREKTLTTSSGIFAIFSATSLLSDSADAPRGKVAPTKTGITAALPANSSSALRSKRVPSAFFATACACKPQLRCDVRSPGQAYDTATPDHASIAVTPAKNSSAPVTISSLYIRRLQAFFFLFFFERVAL